MSEVGKVTYKISGDNSSFESDVNHSKNIASRAASAIGGAFVTAMAAASAAVIAGATAGVKYNAQMEQYATSFEVMLGSSEKALAKIAELKKFAAETPFEMTDLADATKVMLGFGIAEDKAADMLKVLGDISQGDSQKLGALTLAFSQMSSTGKLMGQDLLQMINAGFNPLNEISKKTGETMAEVKARMEKGAVSAEEVTEAFKSATAEGGLFYGSMDKQSKTFNGQMSTLKDNAMSFLGELTAGLTDIAKNDALPFLSEELGKLQAAFSENGFEGIADAFGEVLGDITGRIMDAIPDIASAASSIITGLLEGIAENTDTIASGAAEIIEIFAQGLVDSIPLLIDISASLIEGLVNGISDNAEWLVDSAYVVFTKFLDSLTSMIPTIIPVATEIILDMVAALTDPANLTMLINSAVSLVLALVNGLIVAVPKLIAAIPPMIMALVKALTAPEMLTQLVKAALDLTIALALGLVDAIPELMDVVPEIITNLVETIVSPEFIGMLLNAGVQLIFALAEGILSSITSIIESGFKIKDSLMKVFKDSISEWKQIGKNIVGGIWDGIVSSWDSLVANFTSKVGGLVKAVKRMLGIHSPSTVMKEIFVNFVAGGNVGFDDEFPDFERKVTRQYGGLFTGIRAESSITPAAAIAGGGGNVLQLITPVQIDGREVARATAEYTGQQLSHLQ